MSLSTKSAERRRLNLRKETTGRREFNGLITCYRLLCPGAASSGAIPIRNPNDTV